LEDKHVGATLGTGFTSLANTLALMGLGVATLAIVALGLGMMFSIFDRTAMHMVKDGLLRVLAGSALVGGAGVAASFITTNFHL
jgi:hypothetical protein